MVRRVCEELRREVVFVILYYIILYFICMYDDWIILLLTHLSCTFYHLQLLVSFLFLKFIFKRVTHS